MDEKDGRMYGFVRFGDMNDQREALIHMNGFNGLGTPIKVSMAIPRPCLSEATALAQKQSAQYSHMYESYQTDRGAWGNYGAFQNNQGHKAAVLVSGSTKVGGGYGAMDWDLLMMPSDDDDSSDSEDEEQVHRVIGKCVLLVCFIKTG